METSESWQGSTARGPGGVASSPGTCGTDGTGMFWEGAGSSLTFWETRSSLML